MTPTQRKAMEQLLYVVEAWDRGCDHADYWRDCCDAIEAGRAALAESERDWSLLEATQESLREHMEEVQQLRKALEFTAQHKSSDWPERCQQMVDQARAALAEPQGEPYCYTYTENGEEYFAPPTAYVPDNAKPLYTVPQPRREPLTDDEIREAAPNWVDDLIDFQAGIRFAERAHGITGETK